MSGLGSYDLPVREADLYRWNTAILDAQRAAADDAKHERDEGTCVLGAGVAVWVIPARKRNPRRRLLVQQPFQGNVGSFKACRRALELVQAAGLSGAEWYDGVMD